MALQYANYHRPRRTTGGWIPTESLIKKPEEILQYQLVNWFKSQYPKYRNLIWHIPNGFVISSSAQRNRAWRIKMGLLGVLPGVPDLLIMVPNKEHPGLIIELKAGKNGLTDCQKTILGDLDKVGYRTAACWSLEEAQMIVRDYFKQERKVA